MAAAVRDDALPLGGAPSLQWPVRDGERTPGKVAIFSTCYVNYNEPGIGHDLAQAARAQRDPVRRSSRSEACCGMPKLELGDLDERRGAEGREHPGARARYARDGLRDPHAGAVVHADVQAGAAADVSRTTPTSQAVRDAMFDPFEYLVLRDTRRPAARPTSSTPLGKVSYHIPCHSRVQNIGQKTREVLELIPGHDGQHGRALLGPRRHLGREDASTSPTR